ncbi:hypothetical protein ACFWA9_27105 [Kitasatospora sp. NPDC059973]|uniref:hypothetical protein n=1 Tax=Kitasatospora sp. NPDC059973 TaxID=3347020 RepID=UPI0036BC8546
MPRFLCDRCRCPLTTSVTKIKVPSPVPPSETPDIRTRPPRMPRGTYAPNFRLREFTIDIPGFVVHPDDVVGTELHSGWDRLSACCQGPSGTNGPNVVCGNCGAEVATKQADCFTQDQVVLEPTAVCLSYADD